MAVQTSTSRIFVCDVPDCGVHLKIESNGAAEPLPDDALPPGWHRHLWPADIKPEVDGPQRFDIHCPNHWYRWNPAGDFFEATPKIRRPRKTGGEE